MRTPMQAKLAGLMIGVGAGFIMSWARLSDPAVIRDMLLLRDPYVFLVMGSAVVVASVGLRLLRGARIPSFITAEHIQWSGQRPEPRHVLGAALFGAGWSIAGTCPGPVAAMIGEGKLAGLAVGAGLLVGVAIQPALMRARTVEGPLVDLSTNTVGL
jgi:uncharacterized membrane protein YedE/YeeE